jgi:hypothetical protein
VQVRFLGNVFTEPLLRNGRLFIRLLHSNGFTCYLFGGLCLATGLCATVFYKLRLLTAINQTSYLRCTALNCASPILVALVWNALLAVMLVYPGSSEGQEGLT